MPGALLTTCPILPSTDFARTEALYAKLGFQRMALYPDTYLILRRDGAELHFRPASAQEGDPKTNWTSCYIRVLNTAGLTQDWASLGLPIEGAPRLNLFETRPWGMMEAYLVDHDGNLIKFGTVPDEADRLAQTTRTKDEGATP